MDTSSFVPEHLDRTRLMANLAEAETNLSMYELAADGDDSEEARQYWADQAARERDSIKLLRELLEVEKAG
jgi:hypothetical protein